VPTYAEGAKKVPPDRELEFVQVINPVKQVFDGALEKRRKEVTL
jgi:hypothetical protein